MRLEAAYSKAGGVDLRHSFNAGQSKGRGDYKTPAARIENDRGNLNCDLTIVSQVSDFLILLRREINGVSTWGKRWNFGS